MPAFLELAFYDLSNPELWVAVGLIVFLLVVVWAGAHKIAFGQLDAKGLAIKANLEEAARIRAEAEAMLADIKKQRDEAEVQGRQMLEEAKAEAERLAQEAKAKLEEQIARRTALADRRIATAETQAMAEVKAAAADLAARAAEVVLADRARTLKTDPAVEPAIAEMAARLQ